VIKISKPSKMKITGKKVGCWSLQARKTCPGSKYPSGEIVDVCKECYATKGMYRFPVVKAVRDYNLEGLQNPDWVNNMVKEVAKYDYFRWFDSGDIPDAATALKIKEVILKTPNVKHWIPTRSDKIYKIATALFMDGNIDIRKLPNVSIRPSADAIGLNNLERTGIMSFVIRVNDIPEAAKNGIWVCPASDPSKTQKLATHVLSVTTKMYVLRTCCIKEML